MQDDAGGNALSPRRVVFDFDGVFTSVDSTAAWLSPRLRARPLRVLRCLPWLVGFATSGRHPRLRTWFTTRLMNAVFAGQRPEQLVAELRRFGAVVAIDQAFTLPEALDQVRAHLDQGDAVAIVSAGLEPLLGGWCEALGLEVRVCASALRVRGRALVLADHCFAQRKVERLEAVGWDDWDLVYTDSAHDTPLIARARETVLVNPSARTLREARALGGPVRSVTWRVHAEA
ncbi:HAD family hydrolase [Aeromicrobium phragmitis]|uniref:HAD family hydrolase n=1 Tax=Aeromicrobium phragmitis TaxID=2478914 RepID=UPI0014090ED6|nr:haloacid dehalogenase-like hydrolase [Aeromicrobium phragmitis]